MRINLGLILSALLLFSGGCLNVTANAIPEQMDTVSYAPEEPVKIIFDTDMDTDVDDTGALAVLYSYVQEGRTEVLATVGSCNSGYAGQCLKGLNTYFGYPDVPIGIAPDCPSSGQSPYQKVIAKVYGNGLPEDEIAPPAVEVYRKALSESEDSSVVIITVGALNNLSDLLHSEGDAYSSLSGKELVAQKVRLCISMGGIFSPENTREEYNVRLDADAAYYVAHHCPVPIVWSGSEIGGAIFTGNTRREMEEDNPVRLSYDLYGKDGSGNYVRQSWDLTTVVYALEGAGDYWDVQRGTIEINTSEGFVDPALGPGVTGWTADPSGKDAILVEKMAPEKIAEMLNQRMTMAKKGDTPTLDEPASLGTALDVLRHIAGDAAGISVEGAVNESITREQLTEVLYSCAKSLGIVQKQEVSANAADEGWAKAHGLLEEDEEMQGIVTKAQLGAVLIRYCTVIYPTS